MSRAKELNKALHRVGEMRISPFIAPFIADLTERHAENGVTRGERGERAENAENARRTRRTGSGLES